jgi:hypothetical protein
MVYEHPGDMHFQRNVEDDERRQPLDRAQELKRVLDVLEHVDAEQGVEFPVGLRQVFAMVGKPLPGVLLGHSDRRRRDVET